MRAFKEWVGICQAGEVGKGFEAGGIAGGMNEWKCERTA